eukprot:5624488-Alexandrium_andersonii.AAC.1
MHFLPFHPSGPRLATASRLDKSDYDALLQVDFRYCQALGNAIFVATQNGYILADGHVLPCCIRRVEFLSVSRSGKRVWRDRDSWPAPPPHDL